MSDSDKIWRFVDYLQAPHLLQSRDSIHNYQRLHLLSRSGVGVCAHYHFAVSSHMLVRTLPCSIFFLSFCFSSLRCVTAQTLHFIHVLLL